MTLFGSPMAITVGDAKLRRNKSGRFGSRVAKVFPIGVVQHVGDFRPQLELVTETKGLPSTGATVRSISQCVRFCTEISFPGD
jgi:hypothetical protein